jgi:uncharacterized protein YbjQ (UPF0145 family)
VHPAQPGVTTVVDNGTTTGPVARDGQAREVEVADWDGTGLPPAAAERMARFAKGGPRTSLLPVAGAAGLWSVGLEPVGEVMGCIVQSIGFSGWQGCGYYGFGGGLSGGFGGMPGGFAGPLNTRTVTSSNAGRFGGYRPYVDALYHGYGTATARMVTEAAALGADGVVGVRLRVSHLDTNNREYLALGTAVRASSRTRPTAVFVTDLAGQDVAKLMHAGWVPVQIARGISVAIRHDDWSTQAQASWGAGNVEVTGYTQLITHVRADARNRFSQQVKASGADGAVVSDTSLRVWEIEPAENHRDHVAESMVVGTTVARFHIGATAPTSSLTILPLSSATDRRGPR